MKKIKWLGLFLTMMVISTLLLAGCGGGTESQNNPAEKGSNESKGKSSVLRIGHIVQEQHAYHKGLLKFKEIVESKTNGAVTIQIFPNSMLGAERDLVEGLKLETIEMALVSTALVSNLTPSAGIFDLPYIFEDYDHVHKVQDGEPGEIVNKNLLEKAGIRNLAYYDQGFRNVLGNKPISSINDFKGYKIRVPEAPTYINTFKNLGANPTPIPWNEVYTALETKVVDGMEGSAETIYVTKLQEVAKFYSKTNHMYSGTMLMINNNVFNSLTDEQKQIIIDAAKESAQYERKLVMDGDAEYLKKLEEEGVKVNDVTDLTSMQQAVQPMYDEYAAKIGEGGKELLEKILNLK